MLREFYTKIRRDFRRGWIEAERESEFEEHPERRNWTREDRQFQDFEHDQRILVTSPLTTGLFILGSQIFYEIGNNELRTAFGLATIAMLGAVWNSYRKIRKNPFYDSRNF